MKKEGDIKRRYQHPDAVSYTPESKDGLMLLIKPSFFLQIYGASAASLVQRSTSMYFAEHKFDNGQTCFCLIPPPSVAVLKILNVSFPPWMAVVPYSSDVCKSAGYGISTSLP